MRAQRALALQTDLRNAKRLRQPIATLLTEWRKQHRRIMRAADRLNGLLDEPIGVDLLAPSELLEQLKPLLAGPSDAFDELRARGKEIARLEPMKIRKAKAALKNFEGHWSAIDAALKNPEKLAFRLEASNELRRYEGKPPLSLAEFTGLLRAELERRAKHRRRAKGAR